MKKIGDYTLLKEIGKGSYCKVYYAQNLNNEPFAIKRISLESVNKRFLGYIQNEINILTSIQDPSIISIKESIFTTTHIYIITEYCQGGDIENFIKKNKQVPVHLVRK